VCFVFSLFFFLPFFRPFSFCSFLNPKHFGFFCVFIFYFILKKSFQKKEASDPVYINTDDSDF